jgi:cysteinyl-tRNA synthetase
MSRALLGETFDVHTGGIDHVPVHHNNEIAQSVCANSVPFVHYWMHNGFLNIDSGKMAKSGENFIRLETLIEKGVNPLAYRYFILGAHYTTLLNFTWDAIAGAQTAWKRLREFVAHIPLNTETPREESSERASAIRNNFTEYINDDLNTPRALALVWEVIKDDTIDPSDKRTLLLDFDRVLGLDMNGALIPIEHENPIDIPSEIEVLIEQRDLARTNKDFARSDEIRTQIESLGFDVLDTPEGTQIQKK